jgi:hypothetical protein
MNEKRYGRKRLWTILWKYQGSFLKLPRISSEHLGKVNQFSGRDFHQGAFFESEMEFPAVHYIVSMENDCWNGISRDCSQTAPLQKITTIVKVVLRRRSRVSCKTFSA